MATPNKSFRIALIISIILHTGIFLPQIRSLSSENKLKQIELTYLKAKEEALLKLTQPLPKRNIQPKEKLLPQLSLSQKAAMLKERSLDSATTRRPISMLLIKEKVFQNKPQLAKPDVIAVKKKIALTPLGLEKIAAPSYISYSQITREKIKRCAYQYYASQDIGEVRLSFVISSSGNLTDAKIAEEKSTPNAYLKEIAVKSINCASPFPKFSKELDYPELSFTVIISFQAE
jgi:TonB family protein